MLRKRSRSMSSKQSLMSDQISLLSPTDKYSKLTSSIFGSPRPFTGFSLKGSCDPEAAISPTSILDSKPFLGIGNPISSDKNAKFPKPSIDNRHPWENRDSRAVGLGIVDSLNDNNNDNKFCKPDSRMVLFGSQLKIQIPALPPSAYSASGSIGSPIDFGIKTHNSQSDPLSPMPSLCSGRETPSGPAISATELLAPSSGLTGCLSPSEMELSEDYTCVISHGPNPRTTHIFNNCIVESCGVGFCDASKENGFFANQLGSPSGDFLSFCYACKKKLGPGKDAYMYRGEKAFCSLECRFQEMMFDEGMERGEAHHQPQTVDDYN